MALLLRGRRCVVVGNGDEVAARAAALAAVSAEVLQHLARHTWPGNVRELYEVMFLACGRAAAEQIEVGDLPFYLQQAAPPADRPIPLDETLAKIERRLIEQALRLAKDNKTRTAELLAIWRPRVACCGFLCHNAAHSPPGRAATSRRSIARCTGRRCARYSRS